MASGTSTERIEGEREGPEWSQLPNELLEVVAKKVALLSDYIRFRSVCKSWRSAARPANLRRQPPFLLLPHNLFGDTRFLFSLSTGKIHTISLPETSNKMILASSCGWLLLLDITTISLSLLNPVAGAQIQLPPLTSFRERPNAGWSYLLYPCEGFLSLDPNSPRHEWVVMVQSRDGSKDVHYCRPGDEAWSVLKANSAGFPSSVSYCDGRFFVLDTNGHLTVYATAADAAANAAEAAPPSAVILSLPPPSAVPSKYYLVKASEGELLLFAHSSQFVDPDNGVEKDFKIFKLNLSEQLFKWSEIDGIGDRALFLSPGNCSMVRARGFPGCKEDCVYFEAPLDALQDWCVEVRHIEVLDLEYGIYECIWRRWKEVSKDLTDPIWVSFGLC